MITRSPVRSVTVLCWPSIARGLSPPCVESAAAVGVVLNATARTIPAIVLGLPMCTCDTSGYMAEGSAHG
jgi:hypothetical protein